MTADGKTLQKAIKSALDVRDRSLEQNALLPQKTLAVLPLDVTAIPRSCGLLTPREIELTEDHDATALLAMLRSGHVSSVNILKAFRKRATIAQQCVNCLTELLSEAIEEAQACDAYLARTGKPIGPLHGLPVSVKEQISIAGHCTNAGFVAWVENVSTDDANIVKTLKKLGAVVFARTNQPQSLMHLETNNNIYGETFHPMNRRLTAGGSTGGEAALMGMYGTPLGIGGDIGGSIRLPATLNGIYGFKPSPGRISGNGAVVATPGSDSIVGTLGPFTRSLRDLELFCAAYTSTSPWKEDSSLVPADMLSLASMPAISAPTGRPLRVGIIPSDGVANPLPPVQLLIEKVRRSLEQSDALQVKEFKPWKHELGWKIIAANYFEDGGANIRDLCHQGGEPVLPLTEWILKEAEKALASAPTAEGRRALRDAFRHEYSRHWNDSEVDVVLAPASPGTAPVLGTSMYWGYTAIWNLLQYPAIAVPASKLIDDWQTVELEELSYHPRNKTEELLHKHYSAETSRGLPLGLQVVAKRMHEGLLLKAMRIIEDALTCTGSNTKARL